MVLDDIDMIATVDCRESQASKGDGTLIQGLVLSVPILERIGPLGAAF